jgi:hypothetical protein
MPDATALTAADIRELDSFLEDEREVKAALIHARRFATTEPFKNRQEAGEAADAIKVLNQTVKAAEARRLDATKTWRANTDAVNTEYTELLSQIKGAAIPVLKRKGLQFAKLEREQLEAERKAEQERLDKEAEEKAAASQKAAERASQEQTPEAKQEAADAFKQAATAATATAREVAQPKNLRGDYGALGSYVKWKFEVTDPKAVPPEHLIPNEKSLAAAVKAEQAMAKAQDRPFNLEIPGVRIFAEEVAVSR